MARMKRVLTVLTLLFGQLATAQTPPKNAVAEINSRIDHAVVAKDADLLARLYADDFVFTHGTGHVDDKRSWLADVLKADKKFVSREHDSVHVELHKDVAIVRGRMLITRLDGKKEVMYGIKYVRVFRRLDETWEMISHFTTNEWHY